MSATRDLARRLLDSANDETQAMAGVGFALLALYELLDERLPAPSLPGEQPGGQAEAQVAAVRIALDVESWVIERGAHDRGVQLACRRIRAALDDPQSFLDPQPMQDAPALPVERAAGTEK